MNVESSTPRSVGRPRRGGGAAEAPSTAVRRGGDRARRGGGRATGSSSRCDGGGARGVVPRVAAARSRQYVADFEPAEDGVEAGLRYATGPAPLDAWRRAAEPVTACRYFWPGVRAAAGASSDPRKIDFLGDRRALRRAFCVRARRAGPAKAQRERYDAATRVTTTLSRRSFFAAGYKSKYYRSKPRIFMPRQTEVQRKVEVEGGGVKSAKPVT